jgi:hypothetical protein
MLAVPCGLPSYMGAWPPVSRDAAVIEPLQELAACTAHSSAALRADRDGATEPTPGRRGAARSSDDAG